MPNLSFTSKVQFGCFFYITHLTFSIYPLHVLNIANMIIITILLLFSPNSNLCVNSWWILIDFSPLNRSYFLLLCIPVISHWMPEIVDFTFSYVRYFFVCFYKYSQTLFRYIVNSLEIVWCFQILLLNMCLAWPKQY